MSRARNIKPGFFRNADLAELPFEARLLFIGMWTIADRAGRMEDRPKQIKMELFPADNIDCNEIIQMLANINMIVRYEHNGKRFIQVVNFQKHQNPHVKEVASIIPDQHGNYDGTRQAPDKHQASTVQAVLNPDILNPESNNKHICAPVGDTDKKNPIYTKAFESFYNLYPLKKNKGSAAKAFKKIRPDEYAAVKVGLQAAIVSPEWEKNNGEFIPHPSSWLNARGWEDEGLVSSEKTFDMSEFMKKVGA